MFVGTEQEIKLQLARVETAKRAVTEANHNTFTTLQELYAATNELARLCSTK